MDRDVRRPAQALVVLERFAEPIPLVTAETLDPVVVHPDAVRVIAVDSAAVPFEVSAGEKPRVPVILVQVTPPEATMAAADVGLELELELQPVAKTATRPEQHSSANLDVRMTDIPRPPRSF
jgi:hypothetical protein